MLRRPSAVYNNKVADQSWTGKTSTGQEVSLNYGYPRGYWRNVVDALAWTTCACCVLAALVGMAMLK